MTSFLVDFLFFVFCKNKWAKRIFDFMRKLIFIQLVLTMDENKSIRPSKSVKNMEISADSFLQIIDCILYSV